MKFSIEVNKSQDHYCNACGERYDADLYEVLFVKDYENGNTSSQSINLCYNCAKNLSNLIENNLDN